MDPTSSVRLTHESVTVLAHPLRSRLLTALRRDGPATATELAAELHTNTGATSYHLRRLEAVGLVADTGEGVGKRRLWRAATDMHSWDRSDFADDPDADQAVSWLVRHYLHQVAERYEGWLDREAEWPMPWRDAAGMGDYLVHVTADQLAAMTRELEEVYRRWHRAGEGDPDARDVSVAHIAFPSRPDDVPR